MPSLPSLDAPTVLSNFSKTTVIKRAEEFADSKGTSDLIIFSCHDAFIYVLGPIRYPSPWFLFSLHVVCVCAFEMTSYGK